MHIASVPAAVATPTPERRSAGVLVAFALANTGGVVGWLPLLTLLLPIKVEAVAGPARLGVLTASALIGAVAASLSNILWGWLSDRSVARGGSRRRWLVGGTAGMIVAFAGMVLADTPAEIVMAVVCCQIAVNAIIAPLVAAMAEEIPDDQKGVAGGLLALGAPLAAIACAAVIAAADGEGARFALLSVVMVLCLTPFCAIAPARARASRPTGGSGVSRRDLAIAWAARLLLLVASTVVGLYLLFYLEGVATRPAAELVRLAARLQMIATIAAAPAAVLVGMISDRTGRPKPFLVAAAAVGAFGLLAMAQAGSWVVAGAGYGLFAISAAVFAALHAGFAMQLLPDPAHRGRDLGLYNLANTLPSLVGPALTWWLAAPGDYHLVLLVLSALTLAGGLMMLGVRATGGRDP